MKLNKLLWLLGWLAGAGLAAAAGAPEPPRDGRVLRVGPQQTLRSVAAAAAVARDGDVVEIEAGDYPADVAVWTQDRLTIRGVGGQPRLVAKGASAEGKAIWVMRGGSITVDNIAFVGARVNDRNGAGIRFERGRLKVSRCLFEDNENGILTGGGDGELQIENSEFGRNGAGDGRSHNLYVGAIRRLTVTGSYFHHARIGHLIKSRAAENHIFYNRLTDETGGQASYELEFPNGGLAFVVGNVIQQGSGTQNWTIVSFGGEGYGKGPNELYLVNNTIADDRPQGGQFLKVQPGAGFVKAVNNLLVGHGSLDPNAVPGVGLRQRLVETARSLLADKPANAAPRIPAELDNNLEVDWDRFVLPSRQDYRPKPGNGLEGRVVGAGRANGVDLAPRQEYVHPHATQALAGGIRYPGALQTPGAGGPRP